jgi:hypothetical protein
MVQNVYFRLWKLLSLTKFPNQMPQIQDRDQRFSPLHTILSQFNSVNKYNWFLTPCRTKYRVIDKASNLETKNVVTYCLSGLSNTSGGDDKIGIFHWRNGDWQGKEMKLGGNPVSVPLCPQGIPHRITWHLTQGSAVKSLHLKQHMRPRHSSGG